MKKNINRSLYKSHRVIYTDPVPGKFSKIRFFCMLMVVVVFFILPWLRWNNGQAFLFDIATARLYAFGSIFWPEDFSLFAILGIFLVLTLFAVTVYAGRLWCGFFCPQSVWLRIAAFFSRFIEGRRNKRRRQDVGKKNVIIVSRKIVKHFFWLCFSFFTAITFVGYFVPITFLFLCLSSFDVYYWCFFWILFFSFLTYFNIGWFREQFCFLVCPYARLQSVMFDENTLIVAYDRGRGEKRGSRKKNVDYRRFGLGDCLDCKKCVTCCPTGIDIRDGLQMECISCAACVDACDEVMMSMSYDKGLIRYARESEMVGFKKKISKVRLLSYFFILFVLLNFFLFSLNDRQLVQLSVTRSQLQLYNFSSHDVIENSYFLKITNKTQAPRSYSVSVMDSRFKYIGVDNVTLGQEETVLIDARLSSKADKLSSRFVEVFFKVQCLDNPSQVIFKKSRFIMPVL